MLWVAKNPRESFGHYFRPTTPYGSTSTIVMYDNYVITIHSLWLRLTYTNLTKYNDSFDRLILVH